MQAGSKNGCSTQPEAIAFHQRWLLEHFWDERLFWCGDVFECLKVDALPPWRRWNEESLPDIQRCAETKWRSYLWTSIPQVIHTGHEETGAYSTFFPLLLRQFLSCQDMSNAPHRVKSMRFLPDQFLNYLTEHLGFRQLETLTLSSSSKGFERPIHVLRKTMWGHKQSVEKFRLSGVRCVPSWLKSFVHILKLGPVFVGILAAVFL